MSNIEKEIENTKKKLKNTPVNKSTETERARLKSKIARLKLRKEKKERESRSSGKGYAVEKKGDATVALVGPPSAGKSTLLNKLTNAESEVADYEFTTLDVIPGMMKYKGAYIQILDIPGIIGGASKGKGRGKEVLSVIRNTDLILILIDKGNLGDLEKIKQELYDSGIRLDKKKPDIKIKKKEKGGINISTFTELEIGEKIIKEILRKNGFINCELVIRENVDLDELIDAIMKNRVYLPSLVCLNKIDLLEKPELDKIKQINSDLLCISAEKSRNLKKLKNKIWKKLGLIRIYTKEKRRKPDKKEPLILKKDSSVEEAAKKLPKNFKREVNYARIWGPSADFSGQKVGKTHVLKDGDILELNS